jgi:hypothetical protein
VQYLTERGVLRSLIDMEDALSALLLLDSRTFGNKEAESDSFIRNSLQQKRIFYYRTATGSKLCRMIHIFG